MKLSNWIALAVVTLCAVGIFALRQSPTVSSAVETLPSELSSDMNIAKMSAVWVSTAFTVEELVQESDVIVRVRVSKISEARTLDNGMIEPVTPGQIPDGMDSKSLIPVPLAPPKGVVEPSNPNRPAPRLMPMVYTDSTMEVLEVFKGNVDKEIEVMQTGGIIDASNAVMLADDALYAEGNEVILFLVDISGDEVHANDRVLYRAVNPAGRFDIEGKGVTRSLHNGTTETTLDLLLSEIESALGK